MALNTSTYLQNLVLNSNPRFTVCHYQLENERRNHLRSYLDEYIEYTKKQMEDFIGSKYLDVQQVTNLYN